MGPAAATTDDVPSSSWSSVPVLEPARTRTRRGRRNSKKHCKNPSLINSDGTWTIFHSNIRGFNSKKLSLKNIISKVTPNVITLNEVGLRGSKKCSIQGYDSYTRNRQNQNMGGVVTAISKVESQFCLKVEEGENKDEYIVTQHGQFMKPINIINVYGEQEGRNKNHEIEERWLKICHHLKMIEDRNEEVILLGDMNKLVGNGDYGVSGNNAKVTYGGKLIHKLLSTEKYSLLNNSSKCIGGPFTRVDPSDSNNKSCLSLVIISTGLQEYVEELIVDNDRNFTPHRATRN